MVGRGSVLMYKNCPHWSHSRLANLVLQDTIERIFVKDAYADINRGIFLVRGENVLLLGEIVRLDYVALRHL